MPTAFRRGVVVACVLAHLALSTGIPLPALPDEHAHESALADHSDAAFPCRGHRCGCRSAEHCWRSCCCFSPQQRLSWARQHGVTPPPSLVAASRQPVQSDSNSKCCKHTPESTSPSENGAAAGADPAGASPGVSRWVLGIAAQKCAGLELTWLVSAGAMMPPPLFDLSLASAATARLPFFEPAWQALASAPDPPPPRGIALG